MLVAMTLSLMLVLAVSQVFRLIGDNVLASRAVLEMSGQLRGAADRLQKDLDGLTVPALPWPDTASGSGYFEIHEGPVWDMGIGAVDVPLTNTLIYSHANSQMESSFGDFDDILMFTSRAKGSSFVGQVLGTIDDVTDPALPRLIYNPANPVRSTIESQYAEIIWFTRFNDADEDGLPDPGEITLHRRTLLIIPNLDISSATIQAMTPGQFYAANDLSVRMTSPGGGVWTKIANSLEDLTKRENRIAHRISGGYPVNPANPISEIDRTFPFPVSRALLVPQGTIVTRGADGAWGVRTDDDDGNGQNDEPGEGGHFGSDDLTVNIEAMVPGSTLFAESYGADTVLSYLTAFDVKVFDPTVVVRSNGAANEALLPGDSGYDTAPVAPIAAGGYVDLYYGRYLANAFTVSTFSNAPVAKSGLISTLPAAVFPFQLRSATYDTWSLHYEYDGVDQFNDGLVDLGTNGLDDDGANGVDDVNERETSPPYPYPLRGVQVRFRVIDVDSRQVRQVTVATDFIPE
jgi:hypothetical protein